MRVFVIALYMDEKGVTHMPQLFTIREKETTLFWVPFHSSI
jgi:hypothetical protein